MDTHLAELMATVARVEEGIKSIDEKIDGLREVSVKRLNDHASRVDSLEQTRDRQRGAAKLSGVVVLVFGAVLSWLRWWE